MYILALIIFILLLIVAGLFVFVSIKQKSYGTLSHEHVYKDTKTFKGETLYSEKFEIKGRPDYIVKIGKDYIPVEVKTGKTPQSPYHNHVIQLIAYCVLSQEKYKLAPPYGILKYPEKEFIIEYTEERKAALSQLTHEIMEIKRLGKEPQCKHQNHQITA